MRRRAPFWLGLACALAGADAAAQVDVRVTITGTTGQHSTSVSNVGPSGSPDVESVAINWAGSGVWDSYDGAGFSKTPNIGANNDSLSSAVLTLTFSPTLGVGGNNLGSGDTDGTLSGATALVTWVGGAQGTAQLTLNGATWQAVVQRPVPARPAHLTWTLPTLNQDGSPYTNPRGTRIYWGTQPAPPYPNVTLVDSATATSADVPGLLAGQTYYFAATAVSAAGAESVFSNAAQWVGVAQATNPAVPTGVTAGTADIPVYVILNTRNSPNAIQVGTAPAGVACHGELSVRAAGGPEMLYLVDVELANIFPGVFPEVVYGACTVQP